MKYLFLLLAIFLLVGMVSADTTIFTPTAQAAPKFEGGSQSYAVLHGKDGNGIQTGNELSAWLLAGTTSNEYYMLRRVAFIFNTSTLGTNTIDTAKLTTYTSSPSKGNTYASLSYGVTGFTPATPGSVAQGDFDAYGNTRYATDLTYANVGNSWLFMNNWSFNADGKTAINRTGFTNLMIRDDDDIDNDASDLTWATGYSGGSYLNFYVAAGNLPFLTVTWTAGGGVDTTPPASITNLANATTCNSVNFTWTNPGDADFNGTMNWLNGTAQTNLTNTTTFKFVSGLTEGLSVQFASKTFDNVSNVNATFQNMTAITKTSAVASFTKNTTGGLTPLSVLVNDTSTGSSLAMWNISWGDGGWSNTTTAADRNATHVYGTGGNYTIFLITSNSCGSDQSDNQYVDVWNITYAGFSADPLEGKEPLTVTFTDSSANATTWSWDIDDDGDEDYNTQNPEHEYTVVGLYTVNLTVGNGHSTDFERKVNYINVTDGTPPASITNLVGNNSTCGVVQWTWDNPADADYSHLIVYKNGEWHSNISAPTDYLNWTGLTGGEFASHTCDTNGNCNATWVNETIGDAEACDVTPPLAPTNITYTATCNSINWTWEAQDEDYHGVLVYRFDEGDPLGDYFYHFVIEPTFYDLWTGLDENTNYTISLKSWDGANINDTWVNMTAKTPVCPDIIPPASITNLTYDNTTVCEQITLDWDNPSDPDFNGTEYWWNGVKGTNFTAVEGSWILFGGLTGGVEYTFSTRTFDTSGNSNTSFVNISAIASTCHIPTPPVADFHADNTTPLVGQDVHFTDDSTNTPNTWDWDFGDGNSSNEQDPTHAYGYAGTFTVSLLVTNDDGNDTEEKIDYIVVSEPDTTPPASIINLNNTTTACNSITWEWDNPADPDYSRLLVYRNGVFIEYVDTPAETTIWAGLTEDTDYEFASHTQDTSGNTNATWENKTVHVPACPIAPPTVSFTSNVTCGVVPFDVQFNDTSTGTAITDYYWEFGDGNTSTDKDPLNTYSTAGIFGVNHSATNGGGTVWSNVSTQITAKATGENCTAPAPATGTTRYVVNGQSSILLYVLLGMTSTGLALYGLYDLRNKFYANIGSLFMSSLLLWYLSTVVSNGTMRYGVVVDQVAMTTTPIIIQDESLGFLILIPAVAAMIVVAYLVYDAYDESNRVKAEAEENSWREY